MPFGIRPSNVRVCHSTTRALCAPKLSADGNGLQVALLLLIVILIVIVIKRNEHNDELQCANMKSPDQGLKFPKGARA
jgi:hypothetical protein